MLGLVLRRIFVIFSELGVICLGKFFLLTALIV